MHNIPAQPAILAPDELSIADTADQAAAQEAAKADDATHVGPSGPLHPAVQPNMRKKSKSVMFIQVCYMHRTICIVWSAC